MKNRWRVNFDTESFTHDHTHVSFDDFTFSFSNFTRAAGQPNVADVIHEEVIDPDVRAHVNWGEGRRIVELDVLTKGLQACSKCGNPLHLHHSTGITTYGLDALLNGMATYYCHVLTPDRVTSLSFTLWFWLE